MCRTKYREEITITNFVATLFKTEYFNWNLKLWALSLLKFLSEVKSQFRTLDQAAISNTFSSPNFEHLISLYISNWWQIYGKHSMHHLQYTFFDISSVEPIYNANYYIRTSLCTKWFLLTCTFICTFWFSYSIRF